MKKLSLLLSVLITLVFVNAKGQSNIYEMSDFAFFQKLHKKIAIMPIDITVEIKSMPRDLTVDDLDKLHKDESLFLQEYFYTVNLDENQNKKMTADIVDVRKTNALLEKNDINFNNISKIPKEDLAKFCDVDAVVSIFFYKSYQIVNERPRNTVDAKISIFDKSGKLIWEYYDTVYASADKTSLFLEKLILEKAAKKNPYRNLIKEPKN